jgi:hypothetical protein
MSKTLQLRRGNTSFIAATTPAVGELLVNTSANTIYVGDGITTGGWPLVGANTSKIAIGLNSAISNQGVSSVAIGNGAGNQNQSDGAVALGPYAGYQSQGQDSVAIGNNAGTQNQGVNSVAIGNNAGIQSQGLFSVAIGNNAGLQSQGQESVAIGNGAGFQGQGLFSVGIGNAAGTQSQGPNSVAIGNSSGNQNQGLFSVAIGDSSGYINQGQDSVAIGGSAGYQNQGAVAVAIGNGAGNQNQGPNSVAIGNGAGSQNQGPNSVAIGANVGLQNQIGGSIAINANNVYSPISQTVSNVGFYVDPVRTITGVAPGFAYYNNTTKEFTTSTVLDAGTAYIASMYFSNNIITTANTGAYGLTTQPLVINGNLQVLGSITSNGPVYANTTPVFTASVGKKYIISPSNANSTNITVSLPLAINVGDSFELLAISGYGGSNDTFANIFVKSGSGQLISYAGYSYYINNVANIGSNSGTYVFVWTGNIWRILWKGTPL